MQYCSDSEDLFGDYDSILEDSSLLAKLDDAEQNERQRDVQTKAVDQQDFTTLRPSRGNGAWEPSREDLLTDSILDGLGDDEPFEDLPASQLEFQERVHENGKRSKLQDGDKTSTPFRNADVERNTEVKTERRTKARRSVTDQMKRTMLCNAAAPSGVSRSVVLKEAVVSEEISVAMQAMETVSAQTTDLGPFFGLPTKVKDLIYKLRGIKSLYGDALFYNFYMILQVIQSFITVEKLFVCFRLAGNVSEPGLRSSEEESDLLASHQRRENSCRRDPHPQRAAVQEEGLFVHPAVHIAGAGEGTEQHTVK